MSDEELLFGMEINDGDYIGQTGVYRKNIISSIRCCIDLGFCTDDLKRLALREALRSLFINVNTQILLREFTKKEVAEGAQRLEAGLTAISEVVVGVKNDGDILTSDMLSDFVETVKRNYGSKENEKQK